MYFDSHAHLTADRVVGQVEALLQRAAEASVETIVNICTDRASLEQGLTLASTQVNVHNAGATTPHDVETEGEEMFHVFKKCAEEGKLVAIGETGLDYHYQHSPKKLQQEFFLRYLDLAKNVHLPVIVHCREAFADFFSLIDQVYPGPGVLHCFTGTVDEAAQLVERGWYVSFSGILTFKKSEELRKAAKVIPLSQLLIETDTPYLAPQNRRGKMNEPSFLPEVCHHLAAIHQVSELEMAKITSANGHKLFGTHPHFADTPST